MSSLHFISRIFLVAVIVLLGFLPPARAYFGVSVSVGIAPPPLPFYTQPAIPGPGYIWMPGYWAWDPDSQDYYWVPGTWVLAPQVGFLWTPPWWGWDHGAYRFHSGYWGPHIGFYGGVVYGYGYNGSGYEGGRWNGGHFYYNRAINNLGGANISFTYSKAVTGGRPGSVSYNGGAGGIAAQPTSLQAQAMRENHLAPTALQVQHAQAASLNTNFHYSSNHGHPAVATIARPAASPQAFRPAGGTGVAPAAQPTYHPPASPAATLGGYRPVAATPYHQAPTPSVTHYSVSSAPHTFHPASVGASHPQPSHPAPNTHHS